jgi:hypothetical protein
MLLPSTVAASFLAACGGQLGTVDSSSDSAPTEDAGARGPDSGARCPNDPPQDNTPCMTAGLRCEYGGTGPERLCSTMATCEEYDAKLIWVIAPRFVTCVETVSQNLPACAPTFHARPSGAACPQQMPLGSCVYPEGMCGCFACAPTDGGRAQDWHCERFPRPEGCPDTRPPIGSACANDGQTCEYGSRCRVLTVPRLTCKGGLWLDTSDSVCLPLRACGG